MDGLTTVVFQPATTEVLKTPTVHCCTYKKQKLLSRYSAATKSADDNLTAINQI